MRVRLVHSGMCTVPVFKRICRESYSDPGEVYATLKQRRGMNVVTVTDHVIRLTPRNRLRHHPDFFLSEEVTCHTSRGTELHVGVYDISRRDHVEIQHRHQGLPCPSSPASMCATSYSNIVIHAFLGVWRGAGGSRF